jgi:chromosome segregation ATPase
MSDAERAKALESEVERLNAATDMIAAEREAWKARAEAAERERDEERRNCHKHCADLAQAGRDLRVALEGRSTAHKRANTAEARLTRAQADALRKAEIVPFSFGRVPEGVDRDSWLRGADQAISAYREAIRALADNSEPAGRAALAAEEGS